MKTITLTLLAVLITIILLAQTNHSGIINTNETWFTAGNPHIILGDLQVYGAILTIEPGCIVKIESGVNLWINYSGIINAIGTQQDSIIFTSNQATPAPGDWDYIQINTFVPGSIMQYCSIKYFYYNL